MHYLKNLPYALGGLCFLAAAWGLQFSVTGTAFIYAGAPSQSLPGALNFWLAYLLLILPGGLLIGYWAGPAVHAASSRTAAALRGLEQRTSVLLWILLACTAVLLADIGYREITAGYPLTDDEWVAHFGGQILAMGQLGVELNPAEALSPLRFTTPLTDGRITSFEWLGGQLAWAAAELTRTDHLVFAICAGLTLAFLGLAIATSLNRVWGWLGVVLFLCSPMAGAISVLTHTHTIARFFVALAILAFVQSMRSSGRAWPFVLGLAIGGGVLSRPAEAGLLLAPLFFALLWDTVRKRPQAAERLLWTIIGGLGPLLLLLWYQWAITGDPLSIPRYAPGATGDGGPALSLLDRFGRNLSHNLLMLALWFAGPIGVLLVVAGIGYDRTTRLLATGIGLLLLLALKHPFAGVNMVGPINYSETLAPFLVIASAGALRLSRWWKTQSPGPRWLPASVLTALVISGTWFNVHSLSALHRQSQIHTNIFGAIEAQLDRFQTDRALIFAPRYVAVWSNIEPFRAAGTYVYDWPRANPDGSDRAVFVSGERTSEEIQLAIQAWPERTPFVLRTLQEPPWIRLMEVDPALRE